MRERRLDLTLRFDDEHVEVDIYEPETGECSQIDCPISVDEHPEFNERLGDEIYSWLAMWLDEMEGEDGY